MNIAVIFAGGVGSRMRSKDRPKQFLEMHGKPILIHTLEVFEKSSEIQAIVLVCVADWIEYAMELISRFNITKVQSVVPGGKNGQMSIFNGLTAAKSIASGADDIVLIHDGVRPLISTHLIEENIESVKKYRSAITCTSVIETVLLVDANDDVKEVPSRADSRLARAPQSFYLQDILSAHEKALKEGKTDFVDSCTMMQYYGTKLHLVDGPRQNIKITTPEDFYVMRAMLDAKENEQIYGVDEN